MSHSSVLAGLVLPSLAVSDTAAVFSRLQQQTVELSTDLCGVSQCPDNAPTRALSLFQFYI